MNRESALALVHEFVQSDSLRRHMLAVEAAMRAYAVQRNEDAERWGLVGLLHDFDYERWPNPPDHPLQGSHILRQRGVDEDIIYAILSHADYLTDYPRKSDLDKALYACDELCGFLVACALVRPERLTGMEPKSVRKKMKNPSFAAAVSREDMIRGAADFGVDLDAHIAFCTAALSQISTQLFSDGPTTSDESHPTAG
jgi:predicted hydrolase (HD superfamily)